MGLKTYTIDFAELTSKDNLRLWIPFVLPKSKFKYGKINNLLAFCESGSRPKGGIKDEDEGEAISLGGEQIGTDGCLNLTKIPYVSFDYYKKATKGKVKDNDILICKDGALTGKSCLVDFSIFHSKDVMANEHIYIIRGNKNVNQRFLFYFTTTNIFQYQVKDLAYKKKAQPGLNSEHFKKIKIPLIPKPKQEEIVSKIEPIEKKIKELKSQIIQPQLVINKVFTREFGLDLQKFEELKNIANYFIELQDISKTKDLRSSVKFNSAKYNFLKYSIFKKKTFRDVINLNRTTLGRQITPIYIIDNSDFYYVNANSLKDFVFDESILTQIDREFYDRNKHLKVEFNDILLVASGEGSIGKSAIFNSDNDCITSQFVMKISFRENVNIPYIHYYMQSIFFQLTVEKFKKGMGNMTNIFVSQLKDFPILLHKEQQKIVGEIKTELDKQDKIRKLIENERNKIDIIIEKSINS